MTPAAPLVAATEHEGTGLDYLRRIVAGEIASVPIGDTLGFRLVEVGRGRAVIAGTPDRRSYNPIGAGKLLATGQSTCLVIARAKKAPA